MTVKFIPPRDPRAARVEKARARLSETLGPFITGKNKAARLEQAISEVMDVFMPLLKLPSEPSKGATVMTEAATRRPPDEGGGFRKGPSNL